MVWCLCCIDRSGDEITHIFSDDERLKRWAAVHKSEFRVMIAYTYTVDHPDCMTGSMH